MNVTLDESLDDLDDSFFHKNIPQTHVYAEETPELEVTQLPDATQVILFPVHQYYIRPPAGAPRPVSLRHCPKRHGQRLLHEHILVRE